MTFKGTLGPSLPSTSFFLPLFLSSLHVFFFGGGVGMCMNVDMCHSAPVEVRGQLCELGLFFHLKTNHGYVRVYAHVCTRGKCVCVRENVGTMHM